MDEIKIIISIIKEFNLTLIELHKKIHIAFIIEAGC